MAHNVWGVIIAGGKDQQITSGSSTAFLGLGTKPLITYSLDAFEKCEDIESIAIVLDKEKLEVLQSIVNLYGYTKIKKLIPAGAKRSTSLQSTLKKLDDEASIMVFHEASRPFIKSELISEVIKATKRYGAVVVGNKVGGAVKITDKGVKTTGAIDGNTVWEAQTPQAYKVELLEKGMKALSKKKPLYEDESSIVELASKELHMIEAPTTNMRIGAPSDLALASAIMSIES